MRFTLIILSTLISFNLLAQKYTGQVIDKSNSVPIPYVNIGVLNKNIGTISNSDGHFQLELNEKLDNEIIHISSIGYESLNFKVSDFKTIITNGAPGIIQLNPKIYDISEVVIHPKKTKTFTLGNHVDSTSWHNISYNADGLGTETGVIMKLPKRMKTARLKSFKFHVSEFTYDKFPFRLNVYTFENGLPKDNILNKPIFIEITSTGAYVIDLTKYNITIGDDFFVALEYYRVPDKVEGNLTFLAVKNKQTSFERLTSQGNWKRHKTGNAESGFSVVADCEK